MARTQVTMTRCQGVSASAKEIILRSPMTMVFIEFELVTSSGQRYWVQP